MEWSSEIPVEPGWYWMHWIDLDLVPRLGCGEIQNHSHADSVARLMVAFEDVSDAGDVLWYGPLVPPEVP